MAGPCDQEIEAAKKAKKDANTAYLNYQSARHNMQAGGWATGAGAIVAIGCAGFATGVGAVVCLAGAGATMISGELWTESAGEGLINADTAMDDALDAYDAAVDKLCDCAEDNM
jgi:hypothetical protein